jgi:hypothetical protein
VPTNRNSSTSFASGRFAGVIWQLIDRACFSAISAAAESRRQLPAWRAALT